MEAHPECSLSWQECNIQKKTIGPLVKFTYVIQDHSYADLPHLSYTLHMFLNSSQLRQ